MEERKSVLIVDDEASVRESLRQILKPCYEIHTAASGEEALQCVRKKNIALVTLDLRMPGMPGMEVLREIRRIKEDIEVIIITAYGDPVSAGEAVFYGAGDFIMKPFEVSDVTAKVSRSLQRHQHGVKIKHLVRQINGLLTGEERKKEDDLLGLSRNLCGILERGESSYPAGMEEALEFTFRGSNRPGPDKRGNAGG